MDWRDANTNVKMYLYVCVLVYVVMNGQPTLVRSMMYISRRGVGENGNATPSLWPCVSWLSFTNLEPY